MNRNQKMKNNIRDNSKRSIVFQSLFFLLVLKLKCNHTISGVSKGIASRQCSMGGTYVMTLMKLNR